MKQQQTELEQQISKRKYVSTTIIAFIVFALAIIGSGSLFSWIRSQPQKAEAYEPLRKVLDSNDELAIQSFDESKLTKTYSLDKAAKRVRVNGDLGLKDTINTLNWRLHISKVNGDSLVLSLDDIQQLPKTEITFDFKCIEGWSQVSNWGGVRFSDFVEAYNLTDEANLKYTGLITPDSEYYVGIDNQSMMHPQTILCYEMNGEPLPMNQGAPLRLIIPVKYGVKHLKRIGTINFSDVRPPDYWYDRGYDYYCGF